MENKHLFFPSPAAHEGFLWVFPLGCSPGCAAAATEPWLPHPSLCVWLLEHPQLPGCVHVAPGTKAFLKAKSQICRGAELGTASRHSQQQLPPFHPA